MAVTKSGTGENFLPKLHPRGVAFIEEKSTNFKPNPLHIGKTLVIPPLILAPMAGVTDLPYRQVMAEYGAGMVTTEMISIEGLRRDQPTTWKLFSSDPGSSVPVAVQLFGNDPQVMAEAAKRVEEKGAPLIDINAGCPVRKVARQGAGACLLKTPDRLAFMVDMVKRNVNVPVTVKVRLGWDAQSVNVVELAKRLSAAGADAITIHARTAVQHYSGRADWSWIARVKAAVDIPVIGNGDITAPSLAERMLRETGCDAVMIGRATMGNPWLLAAIASQWGDLFGSEIENCRSPNRKSEIPPSLCGMENCREPSWEDFRETVHRHLDAFRTQGSKPSGHFRKILMWYSKGCPDASSLRARLMELDRAEAMLTVFDEWVRGVVDKGIAFLSTKVPGRSGHQMENVLESRTLLV